MHRLRAKAILQPPLHSACDPRDSPVGIARATEEGGLLVFTAPAGTVSLTPRGEGGLAWDNTLGENGWTEVNFSILP